MATLELQNDMTPRQSGNGMAVGALVVGNSAIVTPPLGAVTGVIAIALGSASLRKPKAAGGAAPPKGESP